MGNSIDSVKRISTAQYKFHAGVQNITRNAIKYVTVLQHLIPGLNRIIENQWEKKFLELKIFFFE